MVDPYEDIDIPDVRGWKENNYRGPGFRTFLSPTEGLSRQVVYVQHDANENWLAHWAEWWPEIRTWYRSQATLTYHWVADGADILFVWGAPPISESY
jgi:hypothetical protein